MKVDIQSIHFDADSKLLDFLQKKADKLETFYSRIIDAEVYLKLDKSENDENKIVEVKINVPGKSVFAKEQRASFEEAGDLAFDSIKRQIIKHKDKLKDKKGALL